ncbi:MAG: hypothetical protein MUC79_01290 [Thiobacillaceae bacterium]|jgi:hypothetical protein|nr:hypothetical protein [Thiobacillaceae bacterium]
MAEDNQDIFGKIDALLEKRAGFGAGEGRPASEEDFPLLTDVVETREFGTAADERRRADRRQADRRLGTDRRLAERRGDEPGRPAGSRPTLSDEQFNRFIAVFEQKLEDLFIRQQLRTEESIRRALREEMEKLSGERD